MDKFMNNTLKVFVSMFCITLAFLLVGCKETKEYEIKFIGFDNEIIKTIKVDNLDSLAYPAPPTVEGHRFVKWIKVEKENYIEITAEYKILSYNISFYDNDKQLIDIQVVEYGKSADPSKFNMELEGLDFLGWDKKYTNVKSDLKVYPLYEQKKFTVNFYDENDDLISTEEVLYGNDAVAPQNPSKAGYEFSGWNKEYTNVKENLEIYPLFIKLNLEIKFVDMYGDIISTQNVNYKESAVAPTAPTVKYYTFTGWDKEFSSVEEDLIIKAVYSKNNETYSNTNANYWLQTMSKKYNISKIILNEEEINEFNKKVVSDYSKTKVIDVKNIEKTLTKSYVSGLINNYSNINKYTVYDHTTYTSISSAVKNQILSNRNLDNIPQSIDVKFGIVTDFAWLRSYPTNNYSNDYDMDRFQETSLNVGEGVAIYHESLDGEWYFVQAQNYNGWMEKKNVAICSKEEMVNFLDPTERLVVISDYVVLETAHVRMGQAFPLIENSEKYVIKFPTRNSDGELLLKELTLEKTDDYSVGYLEYTYENVLTQAFKLLGIDYSWGDKSKAGRDCSSTMNGIYTSFGFMMPRNTSNQVSVPTYGTKFTQGTFAVYKMKDYAPGTMVFTSSHVMLYIGEDENNVSYLLHNTTSGNGACILQSLSSYGTTKMIGTLEMQ